MSSNSQPLETEAALFVCARDPVSFIARIAALHDIAQYKLVAQPSAHIHDAYFDTPARILTERGYGLRVRRMNERWLLTLKCEASRTEAGVQRREREVPWSSAGLSAILSDLRALDLQIASEGSRDDDADPMETMRALGFDAIQNRETHRQIRHVVAPAHDDTLAEFALALGLQQAGSPGRRGPDLRSLMRSSVAQLPLNMLLSFRPSEAFIAVAARSMTAVAAGAPGSSGPRTPPCFATRVGQVIPVRAEDVSGEMYLLSYAQTESSARFTVVVRARGEFVPPGIEHSGMYRPFAVFPVHEFVATDDQGTSYPMDFSGRRGSRATELTGEIILQPGPPAGRRWLDLSTGPGEPAVRIDLDPADRPPAAAEVTVGEATASPGEHLLNNGATRVLPLAVAFPQEVWPPPAAQPKGPLTYTADGLGDMVTALQACGALSPFSPVPGRLAALCARLNVTGHGIAVPPARELPEPWLSLLAHYHRRRPEAGPGRHGCAAAAVMFHELDGIRLAILGLCHSDASTVLFVLASGLMPRGLNGPPCVPPDFWPRIWVRDSGGRWHATRTGVWTEEDDEVVMRLEVVPPLSHATTWIDVVAAGPRRQRNANGISDAVVQKHAQRRRGPHKSLGTHACFREAEMQGLLGFRT